MTQTKLSTHNRDAERGVLGAVLRDPDVLPDVLAVLRPEALYFDGHQKILAVVADLAARGDPVELVGLHDELKRRKQLADVGGPGYLAELWEAVPTGVNALHHAKLVREAATFRGLIHAANEILRDAHDPTMPAEELLAQAERKLADLSTNAASGRDTCSVGTAVREALADLEARYAAGDALVGLSTGYPDLDRVTGGLRDGELVTLAARPSLGKSALAANIGLNAARAGHPVLIFSLEMTRRELAARFLSMMSGVPATRFDHPRDVTREEFDALYAVGTAPGAVLPALPIELDDLSNPSAAHITAVARRARKRHKTELIVVDYLGLMSAENPRDNKSLQIGTLALRMKHLARSLGVPVLLLAQLNRDAERENRRPGLADLRDSGEIEQHSNKVILLHRERGLPEDDAVWPVDVIVAKNRHGPTGDVRLAYRRPVLRFENAAIGF